MNIRACIFDLDGVVVDTAGYHYIAWSEIAKNLGFEFTKAENERLKGVSRTHSLELLLRNSNIVLDDNSKAQLAERKNNIYLEYILKMTPNEVFPGVKEFIGEIRCRGIKTAIGSASKNTMTILNRLQIANLFDAIVDGTKVTKAKPDPEIFLKCAEELKVSPAKCVVFEDAEAGVEAALAAGMKCVGVGNPQILWRANMVIKGFENLTFQKFNRKLNCALFFMFAK
jgi:beta-phosphoglucomutase